ncbi:hypothetical protein HG536_0G01640 [Torulaspora globosa]|uniref:Multiple RNA-binding domain-containing protein 1 n=1 Tax=Torulaspora globosa TaxID=48254 RepID=A0A7G3ZLB9_9SACH|nr:uncharacterized protein HG536_0G01640 [Torulaspora globosa]QLL34305.1 hypothetical protein HG536_0G01640 [Torulaspora globosa]
MSRIIVKGLPIYLEDEKLKEHFLKRVIEKHGSSRNAEECITDVKILRNRDGKSRRFAFVGYRSEEDAFDAVNYFDGSFINTSRIEVAMAKSFADPGVPKSMREKRREALKRLREQEEKLAGEKQGKRAKSDGEKKKERSIDAEIEKDRRLKEFIETMKPSAQVASWENAGVGSAAAEDTEAPGNSLLAQALALKDESEHDSDDEYVDFGKKREAEEEAAAQPAEAPEDSGPGVPAGEQNDNDDNLARDENISDLDWFKQRRVRIKEGGAQLAQASEPMEEEAVKEDSKEDIAEEEAVKSSEDKMVEQIYRTGRLFLRNILYTSTEDDFKQLFSPFGELDEVHIALDTRTGKSKGFAYVLFKNPQDAVEAFIALDKQIFQGRLLHILPAEAKKDHRLDEFDLKNMPLKKQRELKRKAAASKQSFAWNSLYMNQDAVLGSVAAKLGLQKSQLIDPENSSSAVKQALAEAHVIGDVRKYFESKGVDLTKFGQLKNESQRDNRVILVKNFPYGTTVEELGDLFLPFGKLERFLMPPAGTIAIIQYRDVTAARAAFTKLAYKRFKDGIIYLEMGPKECFTREAQSDETLESHGESAHVNITEVGPTSHDLMQTAGATESKLENQEDESIDGPTVSIFIKNLNFSTTSVQLTELFRSFNGFIVAQVKTKPDPKDKNKTLSMGFGFAEFKTKEQALAVISAIDGTVLDGHKLQLKISHRTGTTDNIQKSKSKKSGKIIVKNLPFEATRKDIFELFSSFGHLKSVRVPKKFDKSARGFAFVEFLLPKEAENAMDQLQGVHLLGRRLVMQFAQQDAQNAEDEIARMTKKVKKQVATRELAAIRNSGGRRKLDLENGEGDDMNGL